MPSNADWMYGNALAFLSQLGLQIGFEDRFEVFRSIEESLNGFLENGFEHQLILRNDFLKEVN